MTSTKQKPMRRCISCITSYPQETLIRLTVDGDRIVTDVTGKREGRGMYICRNAECIERIGKKKIFNRVCRRNFDEEMIDALTLELLSLLKEEKNVKES